MPTNASKPADMRSVSIIAVICLLLAATAVQAAGPAQKSTGMVPAVSSAPAPAPVRDWGPYLDVAFELTYWDRGEIREWREKREQEVGETLAAYIAAWNGKLAESPKSAGAPVKEGPKTVYREKDYVRLAVAQIIDYLQGGSRESLNGAVQIVDRLKGKAIKPEIAFWTGFAKALQAIDNRDSAQFVARVYDIWNNAVIYVEQGSMSGSEKGAAENSVAGFYYRNLITLVVNRAIIDRKLEDLNALGPLFIMLKERNLDEKDAEGKYFTTLVQRINDGLVAPDSDRYRLNFTVAMIESKRLQQIAEAKIDAEGMTEEARKAFDNARIFNDYALKWAASRRSSGVVSAVADHLDITSFVIQRLADNEKASAYEYFASLPKNDASAALLNAMAIFNDVAVYTNGGWEKAGYEKRDLYLKAVHRLWRAIMELTLWTADSNLVKLKTANDSQTIMNLVAPSQVTLDSYLDFLASQRKRMGTDVIPDFAYFGAAEASEKLAAAHQRMEPYSTDNTAYNLWFLQRLQATEMFPLDPREIAQTAAILRRDGRFNLFLDYYFPLAGRIKQSAAVRGWLDEQNTDSAKIIRNYVSSVDQIFASIAGGTYSADENFTAFLKQLREELQRKPDHPVHKLLKGFYTEEMQKNSSFTQLLKDPERLNR